MKQEVSSDKTDKFLIGLTRKKKEEKYYLRWIKHGNMPLKILHFQTMNRLEDHTINHFMPRN